MSFSLPSRVNCRQLHLALEQQELRVGAVHTWSEGVQLLLPGFIRLLFESSVAVGRHKIITGVCVSLILSLVGMNRMD